MSNIQDLMKNIENDTKILNDVITKPDGTYVNLPDGGSIPSVRTWRSELVNTALDATNYPLRSEMNGIIDNRLINGGMTKVFYVDAINGNDDNNGTLNSPFKTIEKAVNSVPYGGSGYILLFNNALHNISNFIYPVNKSIIFESKNMDGSNTSYDDEATYAEITLSSFNVNDYQRTYGIRMRNSYLGFIRVKFTTPTEDRNIYPNGFYYHQTGVISSSDISSGAVTFHGCIYNINDVSIIRTGRSQAAPLIKDYLGTFRKNNNAPFIYIENGSAVIDFHATKSKVDGSGNTIAYSDLISGVIKDTNGVPRNIVSNIVF